MLGAVKTEMGPVLLHLSVMHMKKRVCGLITTSGIRKEVTNESEGCQVREVMDQLRN